MTMKAQSLQSRLLEGLSVVRRAAMPGSYMPVLGNVLLSTEDGRLTLAATDLELAVSVEVGARIEAEGAVTLPARTLWNLVSGFPEERVDMEMDARAVSVCLKCGPYEANLKGIPAEEFPETPAFPGESARLEAALFVEMAEQVICAAATDAARPILTGVLLRFEPGEGEKTQVTMAAADGFRLAVRREAVDRLEGLEGREAVVPARALEEATRASKLGEKVEVAIPEKATWAFFRCGDGRAQVASHLIEGQYPDYLQIIPTSHRICAEVATGELLQAVKLARVFAREGTDIVRLSLDPEASMVGVSGKSAEVGDQEGEVAAHIEGEEPLMIAFSGGYLKDALDAVGTERAILEATTATAPALLRPVDGADYVHVIMPVHVA